MEWKWSCKICNVICDDVNALIRHYLKDHKAGINYGVPMPVDMITLAKPKPKPKQYEPIETEDELPEEVEEDEAEEVASKYAKPKAKKDEDLEDLSLE